MEDSGASAGDYDVFLSFRGVDSRGFTDILYEYMTMAEIRVFRVVDEIVIGDEIGSVSRAITNSKIFVPIFSPKFAESKRCLHEVSRMVELKKTIVPVFCEVLPDDVKLKTSLYYDDFRKLEEKYGIEEVEQWKNALEEAASNDGIELGEKSYTGFCKEVIDEVLFELGPRKRSEIEHFVGVDNKKEAMKLLDMESSSEEVVYMGIYGMSGIGKTTLAKLIYNESLSKFDYYCFLPDIRKFSSRNGVYGLPGYLYDNLQPKCVAPFSCSKQIDIFKNKKVLLILDDVDKYEQIKEIAFEPSWFGSGSRIILTTRHEKVFEIHNEESGSAIRYLEMRRLEAGRALELFSKCAFKAYSPPNPYANLAREVVEYAGGLPLAITVIAKYLRDKKEAVWRETIKRLKDETSLEEAKAMLLISYESLESEQKKIFLDIACDFIDEEYTETSLVLYFWQASGLCPRWSLEVLHSRSLVQVDKYNKLRMHDLCRDLGRDIVRTHREGNDLTKQSELCESESIEVVKVLKSVKKQKNEMEALQGWNSDTEDNLMYATFGRLSKFQGDFSSHLPQFSWSLPQPHDSIPQSKGLDVPKLVILNLSKSNLDENWDGWRKLQELKKLRVLVLRECEELGRTPVFSENLGLEKLDMWGCHKLASIDSTISRLQQLNHLNLTCCFSLDELPKESFGELHALRELDLEQTGITSLPDSIGRLDKLERLNLGNCRFLEKLPESLGNLLSLRELDLSGVGIISLPDSIRRLEKLERLNLVDCKHLEILIQQSLWKSQQFVALDIDYNNITALPFSIERLEYRKSMVLHDLEMTLLPKSFGGLRSLVSLDLSDSKVVVLPDSLGQLENLQQLCLRRSKMQTLPDSLGELKLLRELDLSSSGVVELPASIGGLENVKILNLENTSITTLPHSIGNLGRLQHLNLRLCESLEELPQSLANLQSLVSLDLHSSKIPQLPSSIGKLERLEHLDLSYCSKIMVLPDSFGDLRSLAFLDLSDTEIAELPYSIGRLENLEVLDLSHCGKIQTLPDSLGELKALKKLELSNSTISQLPSTFHHLSLLQTLNLLICDQLQELPELPNSLKELKINSDVLNKVPDFSNLHDLISLELTGDAIFGWNGSFPSNLQSLTVELISIPKLPDLSNCSQLTKLKLKCQGSLEVLPNLSGLRKLVTLETESCHELVEIPGIGKLQSLTSLYIRDCPSLLRLENLGELQALRVFKLLQCEKLTEIPGFGELRGLTEARVENCDSLENLENLTALKELKEFSLIGCRQLIKIPSLAELRGLNVLRVEHYSLERLGDLGELEELREISLIGSQQLTKIPGLGKSQCLVFLQIENCPFLLDLENLTDLQQLKHFNLRGCENLIEIPGLGKLRRLKELTVEDCNSLQKLDNLTELEKLEELSLIGCRQLTEIPGIGKLQNLISLYIMNCPSLVSLENVGELKKLRRFDLIYCRKLIEVLGLGELQGLTEVRVEDCDSLERIDDFTEL